MAITYLIKLQMKVKVAQSRPTICDPMDRSLPGSSGSMEFSRTEYWKPAHEGATPLPTPSPNTRGLTHTPHPLERPAVNARYPSTQTRQEQARQPREAGLRRPCCRIAAPSGLLMGLAEPPCLRPGSADLPLGRGLGARRRHRPLWPSLPGEPRRP